MQPESDQNLNDLTHLELKQLPRLLLILKGEHMQEWITIKDKMLVFQVEAFLAHLQETYSIIRNNLLYEYIEKLKAAVDGLDIEELNHWVKEYATLVNKLEMYDKRPTSS